MYKLLAFLGARDPEVLRMWTEDYRHRPINSLPFLEEALQEEAGQESKKTQQVLSA